MNPHVILFDEPTSALDPQLVGEVLDNEATRTRGRHNGRGDSRDGIRRASRRPRGVHGPRRHSRRGCTAAAFRRSTKRTAARSSWIRGGSAICCSRAKALPARLTSRDGAFRGKDNARVGLPSAFECATTLWRRAPVHLASDHVPDLATLAADAVIVGMPYDGLSRTTRGGATRRAPQEIRKFSLLFGRYSLTGTSI